MKLPRTLFLAALAALATAAVSAAPATGPTRDFASSGEKALGTKLQESLGRWYILEVWSNITTIDFGRECIFFEVETNPDNSNGICLTKIDIYKNGTIHRNPMCLLYDHTTDNWVKPGGNRRVMVLAASASYLVLDAPITVDHWVLVLGRRRRRDILDARGAFDARDAIVDVSDGDDDDGARDPVRLLARALRLGSPSSSVRLANPYPSNCDYLEE